MEHVEKLMKLSETIKDIELVSFENWNDGQWLCCIESDECLHDGTGPDWETAANNAIDNYENHHGQYKVV